MISHNSSAALQRQMHHVRQDMAEQAEEIVKKATLQFDWRHYVAKHPWTAAGFAAALGYFLVPRRSCRKEKAAETRTKAREQGGNAAPSAFSNLSAGVVTAIVTTIVREGLGLASQMARQWLVQRARAQDGAGSEPDKSA